MPELWKAWKAKSRLPTLSTSSLEISPKGVRDFHIPTAQAKRSGKVENQKQVFHFPLLLRDYDSGLLSPNTLAAFGRLRSNCR
jgi:hypothetical protein